MPTKKKQTEKTVTMHDVERALGEARFRNCAIDQKILAEVAESSKEIQRRVAYMQDEMKVNGSRGIEAIMTDQHNKTEDLKTNVSHLHHRVSAIEHLTRELAARRKMRDGFHEWSKLHPGFRGLYDTAVKKAGWLIIAVLLGYFGFDAFKFLERIL